MHFAFWMILVAALLPYVMTALAKSGGGIDNASPRLGADSLQGWRRRADWAHRNHFEAFAPFAAGVLVADYARAPQTAIDWLAGGFVLARIGYGAAYVADTAALRSLLWLVGIVCVIALFCIGA